MQLCIKASHTTLLLTLTVYHWNYTMNHSVAVDTYTIKDIILQYAIMLPFHYYMMTVAKLIQKRFCSDWEAIDSPITKEWSHSQRESTLEKQVQHSLDTQCHLPPFCVTQEFPRNSTGMQVSDLLFPDK